MSQQNNFYTPEGWVNASVWFADAAPFVIALGGRGIGKTFGALEHITRPNQVSKFIYLRRTQAQLDACKIPELNPFKSINESFGRDLSLLPLGKYTAGVYHMAADADGVQHAAGDPVGLGIALSVFSNIRGVDGLGYDIMLYDEFIKESHERPIRNEGDAFLNCYETINRNRELQGRPPLKCILLSNSGDLASPILDALGLVSIIERMQRRGQHRTTAADGAISIYQYPDSPISDKKRQTVLYKVGAAGAEDFKRMALDNAFNRANYELVQTRPLGEYDPLVSIGEVTVYKRKVWPEYYIVEGRRAETYYSTLPLNIKAFRRDYWYLYEALLDRAVSYATATAKIHFERIWK